MRAATRNNPSLIMKILFSIGIGALLVAVTLLVINLGVSLVFAGRVFPGIAMNGISLSGLSMQEAAHEISSSYNFPETGKILLAAGDKSWLVKPAQLGFYLDAQASAKAAFDTGRSGSPLSLLLQRFSLLKGKVEAQPSFIFDQKIAVNYLNNLAIEINQPLREASLSINGTEVVVVDGQKGRLLDIPSSLQSITTQIQTMRDGVVTLAVVEANPVILNAAIQGELARAILSHPLTLTLPPDLTPPATPIQIDPVTLAQLLTFKQVTTGENAEYQITLNQPLISGYLASIEGNLDQQPENARFIFNDDTAQLDLIKPATIGRKLDIDQSIISMNQALLNGGHTAQLSFIITNPAVTDQAKGSDLGITELVVKPYTSYFRLSSPERIQNIKTAAARFHGLLIPPGATLSMSDELGDISLDNGYAEALIILGDQTITGVGGGVCQVSTTLFRTAFFAGYPIVERHPHAYRVKYYEQTSTGGHDSSLAGLDATVFVPLVDLKFTNDTPNWLLMETYVSTSNDSLTWKFYSTKDGRTMDWNTSGITNIVKPPDPLYRLNPDLPSGTKKQVDWAIEGADITVNRTVSRGGNILYQNQWFTRYEAWRDIWEYGPGTEGMPPTPTPSP